MIVRRERLLASLGEAQTIVVTAPSGYGKSTLLDQLRASANALVVNLSSSDASEGRLMRRVIEAVALLAPEIAEAITAAEPDRRRSVAVTTIEHLLGAGGWLQVDDVHHLGDDDRGELAALIKEVGGSGLLRVAVAGRHVDASLPHDAWVTSEDLAFDDDEVDQLHTANGQIVSSIERRSCRTRTKGWPAAVALWTGLAPEQRREVDADAVLDGLFDAAAAAIPAERRALVATLPLLSERLCRAVGWERGIEKLLAAGVSLRRGGEWWQVGDIVRDRLVDAAEIPDAARRAAAQLYAEGGQLLHAIDLLSEPVHHVDLAQLIGALDAETIEANDVIELVALVRSFDPSVLQRHPEALITLAIAAAGRTHLQIRGQLLDQLEVIESTAHDDRLARRIEVERVFDLARNTQFDAADARGTAVLAALDDEDRFTRARCLYALGESAAIRGDNESLLRAAVYLSETAGLARANGFARERALALSALSYQVHFARAEFDMALLRSEEALSAARSSTRLRGTLLGFAAEVLAFIGRDEEALDTIDEAIRIARRLADSRSMAYAAWAAARVAARQRDVVAVHHWQNEVEANRGDWWDHPTGAEFCNAAAEHLAVAGDESAARVWLCRAQEHPGADDFPDIWWPADGSIEARYGDPARAIEVLERLLAEGFTRLADRWRYRMWIAYCHHRLGDAASATTAWRAVEREVATIGHPELPLLHEPEMAAALENLTATVTTTVGRAATWEIQVLGGFRVVSDGRNEEIAAGKPQTMVKALSVFGRPIPDDEMADILWPDTPTDVSRRRLRNVLARVRAQAPLVDRQGAVFVLSGAASVDLIQFEAAAQAALRSDHGSLIERSGAALSIYGGELLPGDRFEEWTTLPRERARSLAVRLAERLAEVAHQAGDGDAMITSVEALLAADPYADHWADRVADTLRRNGQTATAQSWTTRADRIRHELGL